MKHIYIFLALCLAWLRELEAQSLHPAIDMSALAPQIMRAFMQNQNAVRLGIVCPRVVIKSVGLTPADSVRLWAFLKDKTDVLNALHPESLNDELARALLNAPNASGNMSIQDQRVLEEVAKHIGVSPDDLGRYDPKTLNQYGRLAQINHLAILQARVEVGGAQFNFFQDNFTIHAIPERFMLSSTFYVKLYRIDTALQREFPTCKVIYEYKPENVSIEAETDFFSRARKLVPFGNQWQEQEFNSVAVHIRWSAENIAGRRVKLNVKVVDPEGKPLQTLLFTPYDESHVFYPTLEGSRSELCSMYFPREGFKLRSRKIRKKTGKNENISVRFLISLKEESLCCSGEKEIGALVVERQLPGGW